MEKLPSVAQRFLKYVQVNTQADPASQSCPSSQGQCELAEILAQELRQMGAEDVEIQHGIVLATIQGTAPTIGFLAHLDTSPQAPGGPVKPIIHNYQGGHLVLPAGKIDHPLLERAVGCRIITSDGNTLLGADDKAGIAAIMDAASRLLSEPPHSHARVRIAFTPDEEIGRGTEHLDFDKFGVSAAYTVDGGPPGELECENFYAQNLRIVIQGRSSHPGSAFGRMVNALRLAGVFISSLPATALPETTKDRQGFIHVDSIKADVEEAVMEVILRDFSPQGLAQKRTAVENLLSGIVGPSGSWQVEETGGYLNMKEAVAKNPKVLELAGQAMEKVGVSPEELPIRGGTDGAKLAEAGLACPNLFTGGVDPHSRGEWLAVEWLQSSSSVLVELARLWGSSKVKV
jgi:tripeptide aminopeptidase